MSTPLMYNKFINDITKYFLKEDLQIASHKLYGAYMISGLSEDQKRRGIVTPSNHEGFAIVAKVHKSVVLCPLLLRDKITQTQMFGEDSIEIILTGDTFDDCAAAAKAYTAEHDMVFVPPFDDYSIIEGQGKVVVEIGEENTDIVYLFFLWGGGGLCAGMGAYFKTYSPDTKIIGVEPQGAPSMKAALEAGHPVILDEIDRFVDGAAVKRIGDLTYEILLYSFR